jgi:cysteine synthase A
VVVILPDRGDRYCSTIYSPEFMREHNLASEVAGAEPMPIRYGIDIATRWSYSQMPSQDRASAGAWATTTLAFAGELGLEGVYAT